MVENICLVRLPFAPSLNQNKNKNHTNNVDVVFFLCLVSIFGSDKHNK